MTITYFIPLSEVISTGLDWSVYICPVMSYNQHIHGLYAWMVLWVIWIYHLKNVVIGSGSRWLCRRWCRWWVSRCCGWWVWYKCLIIINVIFLNDCGGWLWYSCGIINARWFYLSISEPLVDGLDMKFYSSSGTRWVFSNLLQYDTRKHCELSCINRFGKCMECWQKHRSMVEFDAFRYGWIVNDIV